MANISGLSFPVLNDQDYVDKIIDSGTAIDNHDHTPGKGLPLPNGALAAGSVDTAELTDGAVTNVKVDASAGIEFSKLESLPSSQIIVGSAGNVPSAVSMSGDATLADSGAITFATVNSNVGAFGSSTSIPSFTVNAKGLVTAASGNVVVAPAGTLTGATLAAGVTASSLTSVGTLATGVWNASVIGMQYGGSGKALTAVAGGIVWTDSDSMEVLAAGSAGQVLTSGGTGTPTWTSSLTNPMNTAGDMIYGAGSGAATRLPKGTAVKGMYLGVDVGGANVPGWQWGLENVVTSVDYTITDTDGYTIISVSTGASNRTMTLPTLADNIGRSIKFVKTDSGTGNVIIDAEGSDLINDEADFYLFTENSAVIVTAGAGGWFTDVKEKMAMWASSNTAGTIGTGGTDQVFEDVTTNYRGSYNSTTGIWTASRAGNVQVCWFLITNAVTLSVSQRVNARMYLNGNPSVAGDFKMGNGSASAQYSSGGSLTFPVAKNDQIKIFAISSAATTRTTDSAFNYFTITSLD